VLYEYTLTDSQYVVLHHFAAGADNGAIPYTAPVLHREALYGLTYRGGATDQGTIYKYDPATKQFELLYSLGALSGKNPFGGLVAVDGWLYGMTSDHLDRDAHGTMFRLSPEDFVFEVLHRFGGGSQGGYPYDSLVYDGRGKLYGATLGYYTNLTDEGVLFCYEILTGKYTVLHDFSQVLGDGAKPNGSPALSADGTTMYCLTHGSEVWSGPEYGTLFSMNTDGSHFRVLHTFSGGYAGDTPMRTPLLEGPVVWGTCAVGGAPQEPDDQELDARGYGLIWRFDLAASPTAAEIEYFVAIRAATGCVLLQWRTSMEVNSLGFFVERSVDGLSWARLLPKIILAEGLFGGAEEYSLEDSLGYLHDLVTYRLQLVRIDGTHEIVASARVSPINILTVRSSGDTLLFDVRGTAHQRFTLQASSDLRNSSWLAVCEGVLGGAGEYVASVVIDPQTPASFYRVVFDAPRDTSDLVISYEDTVQGPLTPSFSHPMGEAAPAAAGAGEGDGVVHPGDSSVIMRDRD